MAEEKIVYNEVVPDNPFPGEPEVDSYSSKSPKGIETNTEAKDKSFPQKRFATELLSTALNTRSKKILGEFELAPSGALQIGNFKEGISGDLRLTPNGLTARDIAGLTTFAIDGTTGDAVFKGSVQAGATIVANTIVTEQASNGNGRTVYYNDGIASIVIGDPS